MEIHNELKDKVELNVSLIQEIHKRLKVTGIKNPETVLSFTLAVYNSITKELSDEYSSNVIGDALDNVSTEIRELGSKFEEFSSTVGYDGLKDIMNAIQLLDK